EPGASPRGGGGAGRPERGVFFSVLYGFQEQGRGKDLVRLDEIGTAMISLEECCWEMQLQQQQQQKVGAPLQQLVVVPIRVRKDGWASDAMLYVSNQTYTSSLSPLITSHTHPLQLPANYLRVCISLGFSICHAGSWFRSWVGVPILLCSRVFWLVYVRQWSYDF
uniref:Uncharacterized protein n=1 Tax=Aegilops tauschii subsp. strangulata TaxID=200361 RepID=A0A453E612_AEGTS